MLLLISCQDKVICPAFQSTFILDDSTRNAYFSYVWQLDEETRDQFLNGIDGPETNNTDIEEVGEGSLDLDDEDQEVSDYYAYAGEKVVPWRSPNRTKYGITKEEYLPLKKYRMRTAPMENVLKPSFAIEEELEEQDQDSLQLDLAATDTLAIYEEEDTNEPQFLFGYEIDDNFNVEQYYYNKYFGEQLYQEKDPNEKQLASDSIATDSTQTQEKEPFFKRLFKKKDKEEFETDSLTTDVAPTELEEDQTEDDNGQ